MRSFSRDCRCLVSELLSKGTQQRYFFFPMPVVFVCLLPLYLQTVSFKLLLPTTSVVFSCIITPSLSFAGRNQMEHKYVWLLESPLSCVILLCCKTVSKSSEKLTGVRFPISCLETFRNCVRESFLMVFWHSSFCSQLVKGRLEHKMKENLWLSP